MYIMSQVWLSGLAICLLRAHSLGCIRRPGFGDPLLHELQDREMLVGPWKFTLEDLLWTGFNHLRFSAMHRRLVSPICMLRRCYTHFIPFVKILVVEDQLFLLHFMRWVLILVFWLGKETQTLSGNVVFCQVVSGVNFAVYLALKLKAGGGSSRNSGSSFNLINLVK